MAVCKACNAELPKNAKLCPQCGTKVYQPPKNIRILAIVGAVIAIIGGLLPFIQNAEKVKDAYSYMSYLNNKGYEFAYHQILWYLFMAALVATCIIVVLKKEVFSIITTVIAGVIFALTMKDLSTFLSSPEYKIGCGTYVVIAGLIIAVAGCFIDILKYRKTIQYDTRYLTNNKSTWSRMVNHKWFYLMFLPVLVFILIFNYWPMLGIRYAFTDYTKLPVYVGIKHFAKMASKDTYFWMAFRNTLELSILKLILNTFMAVVISLLLHEITNIHFKKTVQTIIYLPHFMSWVVVASIFRMLLTTSESGLVNQVLVSLNIIEEPIFWLGTTETWRPVYYIVNVWKDTGWGTILFLATLSGISPELYEAAQIDGANRWNRMCYITLPALANTIITVFILNLAKVMNLFESVFVMMNDAVIEVSNVIQTYIYTQSFTGVPNYGYTTAVGLFKSLVSCILVLGCDYASKKVRGRGIV
ncbi:MAG: ABC transporter permease subunit [Thermoflexaceae bacterium]|nr:ABC transporter permease subunit [Thermoflexaceae bacterium]